MYTAILTFTTCPLVCPSRAAHAPRAERRGATDTSCHRNMGERRSARTLALTCALLGVGLLLFKFTRVSIALFHWAEKQIDRNSPLHMLAFLAVTLPFNIGLPIPIVHQARGRA